MSADQQAFQVAMSALQEAEEEVVDLHGQYFAHRDKMDKMLIPLYQMTNEVDYDVDGKQYLPPPPSPFNLSILEDSLHSQNSDIV